ncbi:MAG: AAA family ATPase [Lachnospiraceae bacterium]|nr:AAA family ATPase [Lachnospiraceae bacterium]
MRNGIANNCKVIALTNQKGGVAKSFTTASLAVGLVQEGKRVLVIDNDPQGHASRCLGIKNPELTIADVMDRLIKGEQLQAGYGIITTEEGVDLLPANVNYAMLEFSLISVMSREKILEEFVQLEREFYDYILIDCPPNLGIFVLNALNAADYAMIPVKLEDLSIDGLQQLIQTIGMARRHLNPSLEICGILFTVVEPRKKISLRRDISAYL